MAPQRLGNSTCPSRCRSTSFILAGLFLCAIIARHTTVVADEAPAGSKASTSNPAVAGSASPAADAATATAAAATTSTTQPPPIIITNRPLLGQNGTGLRWTNNTRVPSSSKPMVVSEPIIPAATSKPELSTTKVVGTTSTTGKVAPTISPREVAAPAPAKVDPPSSSPWEDEYLSNVDTDKAELTDEELRAKNLTLGTEQHHVYYNSTTIQSPDVQEYLKTFQNLTPNTLLSKSHRRALTIHLKFEFPFYGHLVENITVATGGFIYTGDYVHSWLAATQFIAPLMANFDTSLSNDSFVKYYDNGTAFTILWENVRLQDLSKKGGFTFSATLHQNGDIVFGYYKIPVSIDSIEDKKHPVKVGLSDAYISDKMVFYTRRKTIFEYHRLNFESTPINSNTMIILKPEPTCNIMQTCSECMALTTFKCGWCPTMNRCSTGTDRKRHDWLLQGCEKSQITTEAECPSHDIPVRVSTVKPNQMPAPGASRVHDSGEVDPEEKGHVGTAMGIFIPFGLVILVVGWIMYAYRNPHTKSGQLLIQYRPSQWSWRRGEARYTAATIHM